MKKLQFAALLALVGAGFAVSSAQAATTTFATDDLFLGFRQDGNTTTDILIDLGQASQYRDGTTTGSLNSIIGSGLGSLLSSSFGSTWFTDGTVHWGIVGSNGGTIVGSDATNTLYISNPETNSVLPTSSTNQIQNGAFNDINTMKNNSFVGLPTATGLNNGLTQAASGSDSWATHAGNFFGDTTQFGAFEDTVSGSSALDLYRLTRSGGNAAGKDGLRGTFSINSAGTVSYAAAVPEPTAVSLLGGAGLLFLARNRKRSVIA